jgi:hypothetical protein
MCPVRTVTYVSGRSNDLRCEPPALNHAHLMSWPVSPSGKILSGKPGKAHRRIALGALQPVGPGVDGAATASRPMTPPAPIP